LVLCFGTRAVPPQKHLFNAIQHFSKPGIGGMYAFVPIFATCRLYVPTKVPRQGAGQHFFSTILVISFFGAIRALKPGGWQLAINLSYTSTI